MQRNAMNKDAWITSKLNDIIYSTYILFFSYTYILVIIILIVIDHTRAQMYNFFCMHLKYLNWMI
jgi:hypothetical protein